MATGLSLSAALLVSPAALAHEARPPVPRAEHRVAALRTGQVQLRQITSGFSSPVFVTNAADGSRRLFVVERSGDIRVLVGTTLQQGYFLDIRSKVLAGSERGLLGLAFHPDFTANHKLYVDYTRASDGDIVVAEYTAAADGASVSTATERVLLVIDHSTYANHNGGMLAFGSDGYLYIGTGDGGGGGDPLHNGQDTYALLGKILRIDVDGTAGGQEYRIPAGNPFASVGGAPEVWDYGLRNPWRFSFDRSTGSLWIGDVGQSSWEEVDRESSGTGGRNYGWNVMEGLHCYSPSTGCSQGGLTLPVLEYSHSYGCAITGGYVYRGTVFPDLVGQYVFADYCSGNLWTVASGGTAATFQRTVAVNISSFGEGEDGELYATDLGGRLFQVVAPSFEDIVDSPFFNDIIWLYNAGITGGCTATTYCPTANVTRGQMAAFLDRALSAAVDHAPTTSPTTTPASSRAASTASPRRASPVAARRPPSAPPPT